MLIYAQRLRAFLCASTLQPNTYFPVMGLGTAGGATDKGFGVWPECWVSCNDGACTQPKNVSSCAQYTQAAVAIWLQLGGRRIDSANR